MEQAHLIIGSDLTENSDLAISVGAQWSKKLNLKTTVMYIDDKHDFSKISVLFPEYTAKSKSLSQAVDQSIEEKLDAQIQRVIKTPSKIETLITRGSKIKKYLEAIDAKKCKLLVVPVSEEDDGLFFGGLVEKLIRLSPVPILIVKDQRVMYPKSISFPFAFQGLSQDAFQWATSVASFFDAKITPVHVFDQQSIQDELDSSDLNQEIKALESFYSENSNFGPMSQCFEQLKRKGQLNKFDLTFSGGESTKETLLAQLNALNSDLIVMGTNGKTAAKTFFLGSFSELVLRNGLSSLLITKVF